MGVGAEVARLIASLELKDNFTPAANKAIGSLGKLESRTFRIGQNIGKGLSNAAVNLGKIGLVASAGIAVAVRGGIQSLAELEDATTSVDGAIAQMGLTGQLTSAQVATWANEIETNIGAAFDDKEITAAAATLIRFGKTTPQNLQPALQVVADLATKTGSVDSAAQLLAKALADPTKAAGKLARSGVVLTKAQQDQIKAFVKVGKTAKAQQVILDALTQTTKGAAAASQGPYRRALAVLADVTEDAQRALAIGFLPVLEKVADLLSKELAKPATLDNIRNFGTMLAGSLDKLIDIARKLPWDTIGNSLKIAGAGAKAVLDAFTGLPPWIQTAVLTGWGLNKLTGGALGDIVGELGKGLIKGVLGMTAGLVNVKAAAVTVSGPGVGTGGLPGAAGAAGGIALSTLGLGVITVALTAGTIAILADLITNTGKGRELPGKAETASARGVPDWNNKALQTLQTIATNTGRQAPITDKDQRANEAQEKTYTAVETMRGNIAKELQSTKATTSDGLADAKAAIDASKASLGAAAAKTTSAAFAAGVSTSSAVRAAGGAIVAAIRPPTVQTDVKVYVTAAGVTKSVTQQTRYGPGNGSAGGAFGDGGGAMGGR